MKQLKTRRYALAPDRGAHAPPRARFGASPKHSYGKKFAIARARSPAREARALPRVQGFTLIELLVVIAIIAVLLGLAFPVFQGVLDRAKKAQAKNDVTQVVTAVNAFYTEYGRYPTSATTDATATYGPRGSTTENGALLSELRATTSVLNTRQIVFISPPDAKDQTNPKSGIKSSTGGYYDLWGREYAVALDADYDNQITPNPYGDNHGAGASPLRQGVIAWSLGKDGMLGEGGKYTDSDDVISWQ